MSVLKRASDMLKYEGVKSTAWRGAKWLTSRSNPFEEVPLATVFKQDVLAVDWTQDRDLIACLFQELHEQVSILVTAAGSAWR